MTIPKLTPYTGQVANPDGSQTQTEFTQNMFDQLSYEAQLATQLDATIDGMNNAVDEVEANAVSAQNSANAAEAAAASAGYQGLWPDTGGSALKGEIWQTQVGGTPTGEYYTALQDTSIDPVGDNVNWKVQNDLNTGNLSDYTDIVFGSLAEMQSSTSISVGGKLKIQGSDSAFSCYVATSTPTPIPLQNSLYAGILGFFDGINYIEAGNGGNTLIKNPSGATRFHIEPGIDIDSGTASKQDWMFDRYHVDPNNYRIFGTFLQNGDLSGNGRNAEANFTLKSVGDFYGGFPLGMWGYQDNSAERAIAMKMFYMDIQETEKPTPNLGRWQSGITVAMGDYIQSNNFDALPSPTYGLYKATSSGTTGGAQPIHTSGSVSDGGVTWEFVKDYYTTAASNELIAMMLFGRKGDYPIAGGHNYTAQFARGLGVHQGQDIAHFDSDGTLSGYRRAIGPDIYDYFKDSSHYYRYTDTFTQHAGGGTIRSLKTVNNDDGGTGITVDARGADVINLDYLSPTSISTILCDQNQEFRIRVVNDSTVTLNNGPSLRMVNGTQSLGVRSVLSFFARSNNQAIEDGYVGS